MCPPLCGQKTTEYTCSYIAFHDNTFVLTLQRVAICFKLKVKSRTAKKICSNIHQMLTLSNCLCNYKFGSRLGNSHAVKSSVFIICRTNAQFIKSFFLIVFGLAEMELVFPIAALIVLCFVL